MPSTASLPSNTSSKRPAFLASSAAGGVPPKNTLGFDGSFSNPFFSSSRRGSMSSGVSLKETAAISGLSSSIRSSSFETGVAGPRLSVANPSSSHSLRKWLSPAMWTHWPIAAPRTSLFLAVISASPRLPAALSASGRAGLFREIRPSCRWPCNPCRAWRRPRRSSRP